MKIKYISAYLKFYVKNQMCIEMFVIKGAYLKFYVKNQMCIEMFVIKGCS